jgi:hypothetical protein
MGIMINVICTLVHRAIGSYVHRCVGSHGATMYTSNCTWFYQPIGLFTVLLGVIVPVPCRVFMTRCAHSHVWLVRVCGYMAIVLLLPRSPGVVAEYQWCTTTHSQTCCVVRRSCHGQTRAVVLRFPLWPSCKMMMCYFASDRLPGRIKGTLTAGYDKRCIQDHLVTSWATEQV